MSYQLPKPLPETLSGVREVYLVVCAELAELKQRLSIEKSQDVRTGLQARRKVLTSKSAECLVALRQLKNKERAAAHARIAASGGSVTRFDIIVGRIYDLRDSYRAAANDRGLPAEYRRYAGTFAKQLDDLHKSIDTLGSP